MHAQKKQDSKDEAEEDTSRQRDSRHDGTLALEGIKGHDC